MRFLDAILSNNSTDDHCQEFLNQNGLVPLFKLMQLPNLPLDFPLLPACFSISTVFKTILVCLMFYLRCCGLSDNLYLITL